MLKTKRIDWTRDQLVAVLALYCQIPFGQMDHRKPIVKSVAAKIGRTPSAVAYKLSNFASLDPYHHARGVGGMPNSSALDRQIWKEFYGRWEQLAESSPIADTRAQADGAAEAPFDLPAGPTEVERLQKARRGQAFFRNAVLAAYQLQCCITGIKAVELLRASHIVPRSESPADRLNPRNGLCLNALHDSAFDRGLITLDADRKLLVSKRVKSVMPSEVYDSLFARYEGQPIATPEKFPPLEEYLVRHRERTFTV